MQTEKMHIWQEKASQQNLSIRELTDAELALVHGGQGQDFGSDDSYDQGSSDGLLGLSLGLGLNLGL